MIVIAIILGALGAFAVLAGLLDWKPVKNWHLKIRHEWSVRLQGLGLLSLAAAMPIDPVSGLMLWNMMPAALRQLIPAWLLLPIGLALFVLAILAKYIDQPKSRAAIAAQVRAGD